MSTFVNALVVFCEGPHDTAFVRMVLKKCMGYTVRNIKFSEMPAPFNKLFETAVNKHFAQDMSLDMTHKFFLPDTCLYKEKSFIFLFNTGGKSKFAKVQELLTEYLPVIKQAQVFPAGANEIANNVKFLFLYDADHEGLDNICQTALKNYGSIDGEVFLESEWTQVNSSSGCICDNKGIFVWGADHNKGTLEDIILPLVNSNAAMTNNIELAKKSLLAMFTWDTDNANNQTCVAEYARYQKAVLTVVGQRKKPGASLNVILEQAKLYPEEALVTCGKTQDFVSFLKELLGESA